MSVFDRSDRVLDPSKYVLPKNYKPWSEIKPHENGYLVRVSQRGIQFVSVGEYSLYGSRVSSRVKTLELLDWSPADMLWNAGKVIAETSIAACKVSACELALKIVEAIGDALTPYNKMDIANRKQMAALRKSGKPIFSSNGARLVGPAIGLV